jgi:UMF1 family MFS transporter
LVVALVGLVNPETPWFGFSTENGENIRATNLLVAAWFFIFSIPIFLWVKEDKSRISRTGKNVIRSSFKQLVGTFHEIRRYRQIIRLLLARLFYNDGLITIFAFGGIYAAGTFNFSFSEIMIFGIVLNVAAGAGAFVMGFLDDRLGGKKTIEISLYGLIIATVVAVFSPNKIFFWIAGIIVGIFSGPNQAASRSLMGRFVPLDKENEFFGFFAFSGKATAFMGPFLLGSLTELFNSQRVGVSAVLIFFIVGIVFLTLVDEKEGKDLARRD